MSEQMMSGFGSVETRAKSPPARGTAKSACTACAASASPTLRISSSRAVWASATSRLTWPQWSAASFTRKWLDGDPKKSHLALGSELEARGCEYGTKGWNDRLNSAYCAVAPGESKMSEADLYDTPPRSRTQAFLLALRAAIVPLAAALWAALGTFWTIFAWYHQEIVVPSTAPVNLTTEVSLEDEGPGNETSEQLGPQFEAIQLSVSANNVSGRNVYLLSNYWDASGGKVELQNNNVEDNEGWLREVNRLEELQAKSGLFSYPVAGKYYRVSKFERVAWGNIFPTTYFLYPKETVAASVIFYVPRKDYDLLHVEVHIPTTEKRDAVKLTFLVDQGRVKPKYFKADLKGNWNEVVEQAQIDALPIQETQSRKQLSLWRSEAQPPAKSASPKAPRP